MVTVWLAVNDAVAGVPVARYERQLARLVRALRQGGRAVVLVGNVPDLWRLPAYRACLPGSGGRPVDGVRCRCRWSRPEPRSRPRCGRSTRRSPGSYVRRALGWSTSRGQDDLAGLTAADGFHPSTEGHREVARAFARVLRRAGG